MILGEVLQTSQTKANETLARLLDTTSGAVKTREKLFAELKAEIERSVDLEERHLFPVLRKHRDTKNRVPAATRANNRLRAKLAELDTLPKNDESFVQRLRDLKKGMRLYVRGEDGVLPIDVQAVAKEQVQELAGKIENGRAGGEQAERQVRETREISKERAATATGSCDARRTSEVATNGDQRSSGSVLDAVAIYREVARDTGQGLQTTTAFSQAANGGITEIGSAWTGWLRASTSAGARLSQQILRCRTMQELAETQIEFLAGSTRSWMEHNARLLQISRRVVDETLRTLRGPLGY